MHHLSAANAHQVMGAYASNMHLCPTRICDWPYQNSWLATPHPTPVSRASSLSCHTSKKLVSAEVTFAYKVLRRMCADGIGIIKVRRPLVVCTFTVASNMPRGQRTHPIPEELPPCEGPKLHIFEHHKSPIEWLERLDSNRDEEEVTEGYLFRAKIKNQEYAIKVVSNPSLCNDRQNSDTLSV